RRSWSEFGQTMGCTKPVPYRSKVGIVEYSMLRELSSLPVLILPLGVSVVNWLTFQLIGIVFVTVCSAFQTIHRSFLSRLTSHVQLLSTSAEQLRTTDPTNHSSIVL